MTLWLRSMLPSTWIRAILMAVCAVSPVLAQDLAGTWQGMLTLPNGNQLRQIFKIARDGGALRATLHNIDQTPQPIPVGELKLQGSLLTMTIPALGARYEGKLESGGNEITGSVVQGQNSMPLNLVRANEQTAWAIPEPPAAPKPMTDPDPKFEVATIKPSDPNRQGKAFTFRGGQVQTFNTSVVDLITKAYGVHAKQVDSAPGWASSDKFDITGKPEAEGTPSEDQLRNMIRHLVEERFQLQFRREKKELSVYAIRKGKGDPKLTKTAAPAGALPSLMFRGLGNLPVTNGTMENLASVLQTAVLDRPVVDQTGIEGRYDFQLLWTPDEFQFAGLGARPPAPANDPNAPPDLFAAFREQLGLSLEAAKAPADTFVITKLEKPSEN